ncbi:GNAT family N-acetyltransferase [Flagellimonas myxillae]|uniref:GNAT family N-acetyltransferase n=1 Tax=Flagellimonas myxillae TaxID=2942214 RepID=UPI00201F4C1B|nr:GNAT family N-acetyltransferase [Muricauda myxillae]MCL6265121.1 GNAT family N-acetyltransferase [Muricauda myxillae]
MIQLREATPDDAVIISLLARFTFTETFGHYFTDPTDLEKYLDQTFKVPKLRASLAKPKNIFWLAYVDELPVGYAKLKLDSPSPFLDADRVCQLQKIYVLKDFLSQKIGLELQNVLLDKAKTLGFQKIWLSVLKENTRAIRFYLKNGFNTVGDHHFSIGQEDFDFQVMVKELT